MDDDDYELIIGAGIIAMLAILIATILVMIV